MKKQIEQLISDALINLQNKQTLPDPTELKLPLPQINRTKDPSHGDWSCNIAMVLAKLAKAPPRQLADQLVIELNRLLDTHEALADISKIEIAGPGFINFFINNLAQLDVIKTILTEKAHFGQCNIGSGQKVLIEFVSANPTGPLHVGHGRGAAYGATLASLLKAAGYTVETEYYVNDAGRQMNILAVSVWLRYLKLYNIEPCPFPEKIYQGDYVIAIAEDLKRQHGDLFCQNTDQLSAKIQTIGPSTDDEWIDALIDSAKSVLAEHFTTLFQQGLTVILNDIRDDLEAFGVTYDQWFSEASIQHKIPEATHRLDQLGHIFNEIGATWFRSTAFGDDKDRVVVRDNGQSTYFASDIAYHYDKYQRGYDKIIDILGADHHGYVARVKAAIQALELDPKKLDVVLVQFAILYRGKERVQMSTRSGSFVTLRSLREEVGNDAARFFYVTRKSEQHMDFDLELAKSQSKDNPIYYIQYAHARICSVLDKLEEKGLNFDATLGLNVLSRLENQQEISLATKLSEYPEVIQRAAIEYQPHSIATYLKELSGEFHAYYNAHIVLTEDDDLRQARICLSLAARQVIANGLAIIGVTAPERM